MVQVINKFVMQEDTHKSLVEMTKDTQAKIVAKQVEKAELSQRVEELKYSGNGQLGSRRIVDEFETHLAEAKHQCEKNRAKYERVAKILIDVKAGVQHLAEKLASFKGDSTVSVTDENVSPVLRTCDAKLQALVEDSVPVDGVEVAPVAIDLPEHNRRIRIPCEAEAPDDAEAEEEEEVDDLMDRDTVKKLATMAVQREHKKLKKRGKKSKD